MSSLSTVSSVPVRDRLATTATVVSRRSLPVRIPFCDQNFQALRILVNSVNNFFMAFFYKIVSWSFWIFSKRISHHFNSLANYHMYRYCIFRGLIQLIPFHVFSGGIVDFALNTTTRVKEIDGQKEIDALKKMYGNHAIARWSERMQDVSLDQSKLARLEMAQTGCCFGMSLDFISHYWKEIKAGKMPMDAVKAIAHRYVEGAPDRAQLAQIFSNAIDIPIDMDQFYINKYKIIKTKFDKDTIDNLEKSIRFQYHFCKLPEAAFARVAIGKLNLFESEDWGRAKHGILSSKLEIIAKKMGFSAQLIIHYKIEEAKRKMEPDFQQSIDQLPLGAYLVLLMPDDDIRSDAHTLVFIKTEDKCFIFDPCFGTLVRANEESAKELWQGCRSYYKNFVMSFYSVSRSNKPDYIPNS